MQPAVYLAGLAVLLAACASQPDVAVDPPALGVVAQPPGFLIHHCGPEQGMLTLVRRDPAGLLDRFGPWDEVGGVFVDVAEATAYVDGLEPGRYHVRQGIRTVEFTVPDFATRPTELVAFDCERRCELTVEVSATDGCADAGEIELYASSLGAETYQTKPWREGIDTTWVNVPCGYVEMEVRGGECAVEYDTAAWLTSPTKRAVVRMARPSGRAITVVDAETARPITGAWVVSSSYARAPRTDASGQVALPGWSEESSAIEVYASGYAPFACFPNSGAGTEANPLVRMVPTRRLSVSCRDREAPCGLATFIRIVGNTPDTYGSRACQALGEGRWTCPATRYDDLRVSGANGVELELPVGELEIMAVEITPGAEMANELSR